MNTHDKQRMEQAKADADLFCKEQRAMKLRGDAAALRRRLALSERLIELVLKYDNIERHALLMLADDEATGVEIADARETLALLKQWRRA